MVIKVKTINVIFSALYSNSATFSDWETCVNSAIVVIAKDKFGETPEL